MDPPDSLKRSTSLVALARKRASLLITSPTRHRCDPRYEELAAALSGRVHWCWIHIYRVARPSSETYNEAAAAAARILPRYGASFLRSLYKMNTNVIFCISILFVWLQWEVFVRTYAGNDVYIGPQFAYHDDDDDADRAYGLMLDHYERCANSRPSY